MLLDWGAVNQIGRPGPDPASVTQHERKARRLMFEKKIVVEHGCLCGDSLKDFPLPVSLVDPDLRSTENGGRGCGPGGEDILFSDPETGGILDREIENYDPAVGRLKAWVRIPSFSSGGNTILSLSCGEPAQARTNRPAVPPENSVRISMYGLTTSVKCMLSGAV